MQETKRIDAMRRQLVALCNDVSTDDPEGFSQLVALADALSNSLPAAAERLRAEGYSWTELAKPLDVTRQAAQQRFRMTESRADRPHLINPAELLGAMLRNRKAAK